jgi:hypothetical protein
MKRGLVRAAISRASFSRSLIVLLKIMPEKRQRCYSGEHRPLATVLLRAKDLHRLVGPGTSSSLQD